MAEWAPRSGGVESKSLRARERKTPLFVRAPFDPARAEKLISLGADAAAGFLLSNCAPIPGALPFAVAWMAARLLWDRLPVGTLIGVMVGILIRWEPVTLANSWQLAACALLLAGKGIQPKIALPAPWAMSILAGFVSLLPIPFMLNSQPDMLGCIGGAAIAAVMIPVFDRLCASVRQKAYLELDDRLCCLLAVAVLVFGATSYAVGPFKIGMALAVYVTLCAAWGADSGSAIVTALTLGAALTLGGASPFTMVTLPMMALVASLPKGTHRVWSSAAGFLSNALVTLCLTSAQQSILPFPHIIVAAVLFIFTPESVMRLIGEAMEKETITQTTPSGVAIQWMQTSANALASMAQTIPKPEIAEGGEVEQLAATLCESCNRKAVCWDEHYEDTTLSFSDLLQAARDETLKPEELTRLARMNGCHRGEDVPGALSQVARAANRLDAWETAQLQASRLAKAQLRGQASLFNALSMTLSQACPAQPGERMAISRALAKTRWRACSAMPYRLDGLLQVVLIPPEGQSLGEPPVPALRRALAMDMSIEPLWDGLVYIAQDPPLYAEIGAATLPAEGQTDNGDGWRSTRLPRGRHLLALSDGMGHGADAADESSTVLQLLEDGFHAGYGRHELLGVVNDLMRSCHGAERYATVDLCVLDLKTGEAAFEKMGACASFLIRQEPPMPGMREGGLKCRKLSGGTLPMGILEDVTPKSFRMKLTPGDLLIMVSDGIVDAFEQEDAMLHIMANLSQEPQAFADGLLRAALQRMSGVAKDDMTVCASQLKRREYVE